MKTDLEVLKLWGDTESCPDFTNTLQELLNERKALKNELDTTVDFTKSIEREAAESFERTANIRIATFGKFEYSLDSRELYITGYCNAVKLRQKWVTHHQKVSEIDAQKKHDAEAQVKFLEAKVKDLEENYRISVAAGLGMSQKIAATIPLLKEAIDALDAGRPITKDHIGHDKLKYALKRLQPYDESELKGELNDGTGCKQCGKPTFGKICGKCEGEI